MTDEQIDLIDNAELARHFDIGNFGNTYGGLVIKRQDGAHWWRIDGPFDPPWEKISEQLFAYLLLHEFLRTGNGDE